MKILKPMLSTLVLLNMVGCAISDRTYLAEMQDDDESLFQPREDFPVVPGDQGRYWRNNSEIRRRTPASISERMHERENSSLERELAELEALQSEGAANHYKKYRSRLGSTSERIYFLQLSGKKEREDYLASRGLLEMPGALPQDLGLAMQQSELMLQMSKEDVISSWGRPDRIDIAGKASYENERWLYQRDGAVKYVYFEGGKVGGWTSNSQSARGGQIPFP